jgi:gas vesicle protein
MAYEYDRFEREEGGGSFLMGLLAGTILGAGLGMLFAPKSGSELRSDRRSGESAPHKATTPTRRRLTR